MKPAVSVVIPWRGGCPNREEAFRWVLARYAESHPGWRIVVGSPGNDSWRKGEAVGRALCAASPGVVLVADADVWCDRLQEGVDQVLAGAPWSTPFSHVVRLSRPATRALLDGADRHALVANREAWLEWPYRHRTAGGAVILRREDARAVPIDPRFEGWGQEDEAWNVALATMLGPRQRLPGPLVHLWHPPAPRACREIGSETGLKLRGDYDRAAGNAEAMRAVLDAALTTPATSTC